MEVGGVRPESVGGVFFFNDTATTEIYTLSLHDALPICKRSQEVGLIRLDGVRQKGYPSPALDGTGRGDHLGRRDRKSTRLNSSHANISYAVFCLKKKSLLPSSSPPSDPLRRNIHPPAGV